MYAYNYESRNRLRNSIGETKLMDLKITGKLLIIPWALVGIPLKIGGYKVLKEGGLIMCTFIKEIWDVVSNQTFWAAVGASAALISALNSIVRSDVFVTCKTHTLPSQYSEAFRICWSSSRTASVGTVWST